MYVICILYIYISIVGWGYKPTCNSGSLPERVSAQKVEDLMRISPTNISGNTSRDIINGHFRNLNWRYLPFIRPI